MLTNGMNLLGVTTYAQIAVRALILITVVALDAFSRTIARRRTMVAADPEMTDFNTTPKATQGG